MNDSGEMPFDHIVTRTCSQAQLRRLPDDQAPALRHDQSITRKARNNPCDIATADTQDIGKTLLGDRYNILAGAAGHLHQPARRACGHAMGRRACSCLKNLS